MSVKNAVDATAEKKAEVLAACFSMQGIMEDPCKTIAEQIARGEKILVEHRDHGYIMGDYNYMKDAIIVNPYSEEFCQQSVNLGRFSPTLRDILRFRSARGRAFVCSERSIVQPKYKAPPTITETDPAYNSTKGILENLSLCNATTAATFINAANDVITNGASKLVVAVLGNAVAECARRAENQAPLLPMSTAASQAVNLFVRAAKTNVNEANAPMDYATIIALCTFSLTATFMLCYMLKFTGVYSCMKSAARNLFFCAQPEEVPNAVDLDTKEELEPLVTITVKA